MNAIGSFMQDSTVVTIAHRLSTLKNCDLIYLFENGTVTCSGDFDALQKESKLFQEMLAR